MGTSRRMEEIQRCRIKISYWENDLDGECIYYIKKKKEKKFGKKE